MRTYEEVLADIAAIPTGTAGDDRDIRWLTHSKVIGVARNLLGGLEVFLVGEELQPRTAALTSAIEFHRWHRANGDPLSATRILLPAYGHFDQVGSFICAELLREGADENLERAFAVTEPILELAIKRLELSESSLLGLAGELLFLDSLSRQATDETVGPVVSAWDGWRRSDRDLSWDGTGVEVKTTTRATSSHVVQGVHQVDPAHASDGGTMENRLFLVSVGLQQSEQGSNSFTVAALVDRILDRLEGTANHGVADEFLRRVAVYGSESGSGYDHATMSSDAPFTNPFIVTFLRGYDMGDPAIEVLRRDDVARHHHVDMQSLSFRINLPLAISAENPINGANLVAKVVLGSN